ncbi:MAG: hypothetical protein ACKPKO_31740, partial [Candidatus Fonsibacter sp.]
AERAANSDFAQVYNGLNRQQSAELRMIWSKKSDQQSEQERVESKKWRRIDISKGEYTTASQLVVTNGGWKR